MTAVDFEAFVDRLAATSGEAILPFFRSSIGVEDKGAGAMFDPVTAADRAGEAAMRRLIMETFPSHGIVGEEYGSEHPDAEFVWVLDPIDGTRAFITGLLAWGTLIGLLRGGNPAFGLMHQPFTRERFSGDGGSARYQGPNGNRRLRTRHCPDIAHAVLSATSPAIFDMDEIPAFQRVEARAKHTRYGGDCYAYCMLAAGHIDLVIEAGLQPYDIVALIPIIEGAGGVVTTWDGQPATKGGRIIAAGDKRVHAEAMELLNHSA
ncbi:histidinol-phosphatase [Agaricicola taiwanensis]|uniref:Histidinol-phosphatase n=1 Tax=Agaricicola taiwanensis TaxID=591372 RepID=A0A8J2VS61_9RHOB|nr:histidinol-phosphatase [Agaricicola taiwanensis]GGE38590.1 histidinol-phosphatase [Agaricicola taiwanensis]